MKVRSVFPEFSAKLEEIVAEDVKLSLVFVLKAVARMWSMRGRNRDCPAAEVRHTEDPAVAPVGGEAPVALVKRRGSEHGPRLEQVVDAHRVAAKLQGGAHGCSARGENEVSDANLSGTGARSGLAVRKWDAGGLASRLRSECEAFSSRD